MKIQYGRSHIGGNLGDELNMWLWPKVFKTNFFEIDNELQFLGIGTILSNDPIFNNDWLRKKKIIFGTGARPSSRPLIIDSSYDIIYMRGPLSCHYLGIESKFITDSAYCLQFIEEYQTLIKQPKKYKVGLMPYFRSNNLVDWVEIANKLEMHYISPICEYTDILNRLEEIASCEYIVAEAMHGAIIADILRIPWSRFVLTTYKYEGSNVADFKWMDWMYSLDISNKYYPEIRLTNKFNHAVSKLSKNKIKLNTIFEESLKKRIINGLNFNQLEFTLSNESNFASTKHKLEDKIIDFEQKYADCLCSLS